MMIAALVLVVALVAVPLDLLFLPFRILAGMRRACVGGLNRFAAWAFPRR